MNTEITTIEIPTATPQVALQVNVLALLRRAGRAACEAESVELATALQQLLVTCCQAGSFKTGLNTKPFQHLNRLSHFKHIIILYIYWILDMAALILERSDLLLML